MARNTSTIPGKFTSEHYEEQIRNLEKEEAKILGTDHAQHTSSDLGLQSVGNSLHVPRARMSDTLLQMKDQIHLQEGALKSFQNELAIKAAEMEKLKVSLESPDVMDPSRLGATSLSTSAAQTPDVIQLRLALEQKMRENEILQSKLEASKTAVSAVTSSGYSTERAILGMPRHNTSSIGLARSRSLTSFPNTQSAIDVRMLPQMTFQQSHEKESLERRLHHSQLHIERLNDKLKECTEVCEQQKTQFRQAVEELQTKLTETVVGRDSILEMRKTEAEDQEKLMKKLQEALKEAEKEATSNEQARREVASKVEVLQSSLATSNAVLGQIQRQTRVEDERRGKELLSKDTREGSDICNISDMLQTLFEDSQAEISKLRETLQERTSKFNINNESYETQLQNIQSESRNKISQLSEEHEKQMNAATERAMNARKQSLSLQTQLTQLQELMQEKLDQREGDMKTLEQQLQQVKHSDQEMLTNWSQRNNNLSTEIERYRSQVERLDDERSSLHTKVAELTEQVEKQKDALYRAEEEISSGRDQNNRLWKMEEENSKRCEELQTQLENKLIEIADLHQSMERTREESKKDLVERVNSVEKELQQSAQDQANDLNSKYQNLLNMYQKQEEEKDQHKTTLDTLLEHKARSELGLAEAQNELKKCNTESQEFRMNLEEKERDFDILKQERDHYFDLLKERNEEVNQMKALTDQLHIQVNEGEKHFEAFRRQNANMSQWVQMNNQTASDVREEKEKLTKLLEEKTFDNQEMKKTNDELKKRLKASEKKLVHLNNENEDVKLSLEEKIKETDDAIKEKEKMFIELKESRYEVASLTEESDQRHSEIKVINKRISEDKHRYRAKIVALDNELAAAHSALTASKSADAKAMQVAEHMQKEMASKRSQIDSLLSKVHWFEESLEAVRKDYNSLESTKDKFHLRCSRLAEELEKVSIELDDSKHQNMKHADYVAKLEAALDKAASLHADVKTTAENQEQDMTRIKLRYSLEIKELQQALDAAMKKNSQPPKKITTKETTTKAILKPRRTDVPKQPMKKTVKKPVKASERVPLNKEINKPGGEMNDELRQLLGEMKMMISNGIGKQQRDLENANHSNSQQHHTSSASNLNGQRRSYKTHSSSRGLQRDTYRSNEPFLHSATPPEKLTAFESPVHASSPYNHTMGLSYDTDTHNSLPKTNTLSPVERLLLHQPNAVMYQPTDPVHNHQHALQQARHENSKTQRKYNVSPSYASWNSDDTSSSTTSLDTDIQARNQQHSLKKLEERLQSLSKIGGSLKQENKAMASLIQNQGVKLKQCRQHEQQLKLPINGKKQTR